MGAWGSGPFENDDAGDWSYLLVDGGDIGVVEAALRAVLGPDAPQGPDDAAAVGAVAVVAAALDGNEDDLPDEVSDWLRAHRDSQWLDLAPLRSRHWTAWLLTPSCAICGRRRRTMTGRPG